MQDRFRFRAYNTETDRMYYGAERAIGTPVTSFDVLLQSDTWIVEQCTGLCDKHGELIYEGDIVRMPYNHVYEYADYVVEFMDGAFCTRKCLGMKNKETGEIKDTSKGGYCFYKHFTQSLATACEIIGNIHTATEKE